MKNSFDEKILEEASDWVKANQKVVLCNSDTNMGIFTSPSR